MSLRLAALGLALLLALAGCAATSTNSATENSATGTPTPKGTLVVPTAVVTANQVTLTTDHSTYMPGDSVRVTIANGQGVSAYAVASQANCTVLEVQVKGASGWQVSNIASCNAQPDPDTLEIKPGSATTVTITAPSAGTYRCALHYTTINIPPPPSTLQDASVSATNPTSGPATTVYSAEWEVRSA